MQSEQQQRIMGYFIEEAKDHLNTIEQGLLGLQSATEDPEILNEIFRAAHSIKGGAAMLGLNSIQRTAHRLEDSFKTLMESPIQVDRHLESLFLQVFDTLQELIEQLQSPSGLDDAVARELMSGMESVFEQLNTHIAHLTSDRTPTSTEAAETQLNGSHAQVPPTSFQREVLIQLRDMLHLFKQSDTPEHRADLQHKCTNLQHLGAQFHLPGWGELLETSRLAIANPENSYRQLASSVIKEIKQALELALAGRAAEITPSEPLQALAGTTAPEPQLEAAETASTEDEEALKAAPEAEFLADAQDTYIQGDLNEPDSEVAAVLDTQDSEENFWSKMDAASPLSEPARPSRAPASDSGEPEVGMAELNSLADIFEGQTPDLDQSWDEEEVLDFETEPSPLNTEESSGMEAESDFSDLIGDLDGYEDSAEDLNGWLEDEAGEEAEDDIPASQSVSGAEDDFADLLLESTGSESQMPSTNAEELNSLFGEGFFDEESDMATETSSEQPETEELWELSGEEPADATGEEFSADFPDWQWEESQPEEMASGEADFDFGTGATSPQDEAASDFDLDDLSWDDSFGDWSEIAEPQRQPGEGDVEGEELLHQPTGEAEDWSTAEHPEQRDVDLEDFLADENLSDSEELAWDEESEETFDDRTGDRDSETAEDWELSDPFAETSTSALESFETEEESREDWGDLFGEESLAASEAPVELEAEPDRELTEQAPETGETDFDLEGFAESEEMAGDLFDQERETEEPPTGEGEDFESLFGEETPAETPELELEEDWLGEEAAPSEDWATLEELPPEASPTEEGEDFESLFDEETPAETPELELEEDWLGEEAAPSEDWATLEELTPEAAAVEPAGESEDFESLFGEEMPAEPTGEGEDFESLFDEETPAETPELELEEDWLGEEAAPSEDWATLEELTPEAAAAEPAGESEDFESLFGEEMPAEPTGEGEDFESLFDEETPAETPARAQEPTPGEVHAVSPAVGATEAEEGVASWEGLEELLAEAPAESIDLDELLSDFPATAEQADPFSDLEDMLAETATPEAPTVEGNQFADLESVLEEATAEAEQQAPAPTEPKAAEDEFGDLENLLKEADRTMGTPSKPIPDQRPSRPAIRRPRVFDQTMRVPVKHLDSLSNLVGELVVNRNTLEQDQERLRQFLDNLFHQVSNLGDVGARMQDLYERSLLESSLLASRHSYRSSFSSSESESSSHENDNSSNVEYDPLEMDRFTGFHLLSQEMIELIVRVRESASDIEFLVDETDQVARTLRQVTTQLQEGLTRSRMVPFAHTADRLPRAVREISLRLNKQAQLHVEGRETLVDKMILEHLYDPMTHLVNNAITHGIESPEVRKAAGKPEVGQVTLRAFYQGNQTVISISDDGAGIDPERVRAKAIQRKLVSREEAKELSDLDLYDFLFHPGFSTKDEADDFSGRGVGMDVVRTSLSEIRGAIHIDSQLGKGTTFTIRLPLTLSICKALCCLSDRARIAFPMDGVEDMLDIPRDRIQTNEEGAECIPWRDTLLPFQPLSKLLTYNRQLSRGTVYGGSREEDIISVIVLRSAGTHIALEVDRVLGEQEIVIKQLEGPAPKPVGIAGATVLGDGRIMPIADVLELIDLSMGRIRKDGGIWTQPKPPEQLEQKQPPSEPMVLIVDDSITVRELLSMTFSKAGYRVEQARDGQEAWEKLRSELPCDIVFCDIEMPRMDGLELLSRLQKDENLRDIPIAMLTSRGADRHRQMASQLGASGYFTKPYLEEVLLEAAQRMIKGEVLFSSGTTNA